MTTTPFWWPLELSPREDAAVQAFRRQMQQTAVPLDHDGITTVSALLTRLMAGSLGDIIERDGLPHLAHVLNGWGDARFQGRRMMEHLVPFIHRDQAHRPIILQCDPEGEFHPWQSFAYAVMAGVDPDAPIPPEQVSLRTLAQGSRAINSPEGRELGHLLFALAHLDPRVDGQPFSLQGQICDVITLMDMAVHAHHYGTFEVCRKFHLTEGLCAMAMLVPGLERYRADAQGFLDGQLDMLMILGVILREARALLEIGQQPSPDSLLQELRSTLIIGNYLENHCYYAGHIVELACFAESFGYQIATEHRNAINLVINELNAILPTYLPQISFLDCFLHLGHYRRSITLLPEVERARAEQRSLTRADLARFAVDFDALSHEQRAPLAARALSPTEASESGVYHLEGSAENPRPAFMQAVAQYAAAAREGFKPRGRFDHFRRICPPAWPRALHYELADYGDAIGVELHLESDPVLVLQDRVRSLNERVAQALPDRSVEWDPTWWRDRGRLRIVFGDGTSPEVIAAALKTLIDTTFPELDAAARGLVLPPIAIQAER